MLKNLVNIISEMDTWILFGIPFVSGISFGILCAGIAKEIYGYIPNDTVNIIAVCSFLLMGSGGVVFIVRKEFPMMPLPPIRGALAMIIGLIWVIFFWGLASLGIWDILREVLTFISS